MRSNKGSEQSNQQIKGKRQKQNQQNSDSQQDYFDDQDPVNCPLIFKSILSTLITIGILAFVITFATQVQQSSELYNSDFTSCSDSPNVRRVTKYYAYEKMILGLSISALVFAFGITVFLIRHAYDFCRCFDDCCGSGGEEEESRKSEQEQGDVEEFENQLKKRIQSNIIVPKTQMQTAQIILSKKSTLKRQEEPKINTRNPHIRKYLKPAKQIREIDEQYNRNGGNSDQINCDCQCNSIGQCLACFSGCLWCRTCFQAHHYRFYKTKNQEYAYWILYLVKTWLFGSALAYVIRINVSLNELGNCLSVNAKTYNDALYTVMVIGIITFCLDVFGYIHLLIEGSLLEVIEDTLHEPQKSEHSAQQDSEEESKPEDKKKKTQKYRQPSSDSEKQKDIKKKKKVKKLSESHQSQQSYELPTKLNLMSSIKKDKSKFKNQIQQKVPPSAKDTDSFFITIKTLGNKYIDDIENDENDEKQSPKKKKQKKQSQNSREVPGSQESYQVSNKKPDIFVPKNLDKLPKFQTKKSTEMAREEKSVKEELFWKKQPQQKTQLFESFKKQKESQQENQGGFLPKSQEKPGFSSGKTKFGAFNRVPEENNPINKNSFIEQQDSKANKFEKLSKFSTKF